MYRAEEAHYTTQRVGQDSIPGIVEGGVVGGGVIGLARSRRRASDRMRPSRDYTSSIRFHLIRKIPPIREDSTRSEGVDSFRSGVSPHRQQASSRNSPTRPLCQRGPPRFVTTPAVNTVPDAQQGLAGQPCVSEGACTRGNGGGFAPLEASCRRVAGVSRLYWCNSPRLLAPSTWSELDRGPLTAQFPRLVAPSTLGELDRGPLMARIPRLLVVRPRFGAARRPHRRPTRRQTSTTGCRRRGGLRSGYNGALPRAPLARSPLRCEREPAIACANPQYRT